ncbi:AraC family transcriptional regulator [Robbsia sp. Bb-Pol-6]|uniref:AraC family transcriptional regulator n=1 Tax=Robbsia betulipollinis TaxID=2981849 RepID=A0ABT3ZRC3_9BURK|nr:AraC family transcriptional regulator [Robbsia betulipollinis]MCY0388972.1 AraC family transcriptional regulator [Robbsia betulipollinis]
MHSELATTAHIAVRLPAPAVAKACVPVWTYECAEEGGRIEVARWTDDGSLPLRTHFHEETQVTVVLSGVRSFHVGGQTLVVTAGHYVVIPAGWSHRAEASSALISRGVNAYLREALLIREPAVGSLALIEMKQHNLDYRAMAESILCRTGSGMRERDILKARTVALAAISSFEKLSDVARGQGVTREAFSRRVAELLGMPPHRYRSIERLNRGRRRLRAGEDVATIAADLAFADQSHFTRLFRATFGTTPGRYQKGFA